MLFTFHELNESSKHFHHWMDSKTFHFTHILHVLTGEKHLKYWFCEGKIQICYDLQFVPFEYILYIFVYIDLLELEFNSIYSLAVHNPNFVFLFLFKLVIYQFLKMSRTKNMIQHSSLSEIRKNFLTLTPVNFVRILRFFFSKKENKHQFQKVV